jgi:hypothetical protein
MTTVTSLYNCPCSGAFPVGAQPQNYANGYAGIASVGSIGPPGMQTPVQFRVFESASFSQQPQVAVLPYSPSTIVGASPIYYNTNGAITPANGGNIGGNPNTWSQYGSGNAGGNGNPGGDGNNGTSGGGSEFDDVYTFCTNKYGPCAYAADSSGSSGYVSCVKQCITEKTNTKPPTVTKPSSLAAVSKSPAAGQYVDDGVYKFCSDEFGPCAYLPDGKYEPCVKKCIQTGGGSGGNSNNIGGKPNTWAPSGSGNIGGNPSTWGPSTYPPGYYPTPPPYGFRANECGCARTAFSQLPPSGFLAWEPLIRRFNEPFNSLAGLTCQGRLW